MNANRGMYAEELVNRTNSYYYERSIALIEKRYLPIKIVKNLNDNLIIGKLLAKSYVDYCGVYQSKHLEFEVKQTNEKNFDLHLIKPHQIKHLINAFNQKAISFLIIYFNQYDEFYFMPINVLLE
ncbi:MAG: Holliday junction resolvase RecU [Mycoplasmoidaceae bacterium]|nr:Holliday junction resolvase RecU [Mycoplasmoidaceae bacterium]